VPCDSCLGGNEPAVRTCPVCEMSFCEPHGKHHLQNPNFKDHELTELRANTEARKCKLHKKRLELKALDEEERIAFQCMELKGRELLSPIDERIAHYQREIGMLQQTATRLQVLEEEKDSL
uniref:B box-type domain-containing protein n=1 Tax=Petromyzon marinus TaxID=7757 RepID=S4RVN1_PETMA